MPHWSVPGSMKLNSSSRRVIDGGKCSETSEDFSLKVFNAKTFEQMTDLKRESYQLLGRQSANKFVGRCYAEAEKAVLLDIKGMGNKTEAENIGFSCGWL